MSSCCGPSQACEGKEEQAESVLAAKTCCGSNSECQSRKGEATERTEAKGCCGVRADCCASAQTKPRECCSEGKSCSPAVVVKQTCCGGGATCGPADPELTIHESVKEYYGKELKAQNDLQTSVKCIRDGKMPRHVSEALSLVHEEVFLKYYGCGPVIPEQVDGCSILDLGSGSGRDCFALSKLVGSSGHVVGIDMTDEQLAVARKHVDYHTEKFGYSKPNVEFVFGYIEKLYEAGLKDNTFDIIVSNCVINLCPDKRSALREAHRVLKAGGEVYFSDVYTDSHLSEEVRKHRVLWGECISGALHWQELFDIAQDVGFSQPRLVVAKLLDVGKFKEILGDAKFVSATYRLFKLPSNHKESTAAHQVTYKGGILGCPEELKLDHSVTFKKDEAVVADAELSTILRTSRFSQFFTFQDSLSDPETASTKLDPFPFAEPAIQNINVC